MMKVQVLCGILPKIQEFLQSRFFHQGGEYGAFSQFQSFQEKVYFITYLKTMKSNNEVNFLQLFFLIMRNKPPNTNIPNKYTDWM